MAERFSDRLFGCAPHLHDNIDDVGKIALAGSG
jgi:hypothetical protein